MYQKLDNADRYGRFYTWKFRDLIQNSLYLLLLCRYWSFQLFFLETDLLLELLNGTYVEEDELMRNIQSPNFSNIMSQLNWEIYWIFTQKILNSLIEVNQNIKTIVVYVITQRPFKLEKCIMFIWMAWKCIDLYDSPPLTILCRKCNVFGTIWYSTILTIKLYKKPTDSFSIPKKK